jgi:hypothetical protein
MFGVIRNRDPPLNRDTAHREIVQASPHKAEDLVPPRFRTDELGMALVIFEQPFLERREAEEVALFGQPFERAFMGLADRDLVLSGNRLILTQKAVAADTIPPLIIGLVDLAILA